MDAATREAVRKRANGCCEYCGLPERGVPLIQFHIEHIIPRQHGGSDDPENRALACPWCNRSKGPNLTGLDPETGRITPLFHPRNQAWSEHFTRQAASIVGLTPTGRATVRVLAMNRPQQLEIRRWLLLEGLLSSE